LDKARGVRPNGVPPIYKKRQNKVKTDIAPTKKSKKSVGVCLLLKKSKKSVGVCFCFCFCLFLFKSVGVCFCLVWVSVSVFLSVSAKCGCLFLFCFCSVFAASRRLNSRGAAGIIAWVPPPGRCG
jgi:hypothetical protein